MADIASMMPVIRIMFSQDLDRIVEIEQTVLGQSRPEYWRMKLELVVKRSPVPSLVAEVDGMVIGFIIGNANGWETGLPDRSGWIDTVGVDPAFQRKGIAKMLLSEMVNNLKGVGVDTVYTLVNWRDWNLLQFFDSLGFQKGNMISLELEI